MATGRFPVAKLRFHENSVEKRPSVTEDCPCDAPAHICRERVPDYMDLLENEGLRHVPKPLVIVTLFAKESPYKGTERIDTET